MGTNCEDVSSTNESDDHIEIDYSSLISDADEEKTTTEEPIEKITENKSPKNSVFKKFGIGSLIASAVLAVSYGIYRGAKKVYDKITNKKVNSVIKTQI